MQYREQGDRIQVLAYRGYNKEKKRAEVKMLGSYGRYSFDMTDGLLDAMTVEEQKDFTVKIDKLRLSSIQSSRQYALLETVRKLVESYDCITKHDMTFDVSNVTADKALAIYGTIDVLVKALKKAGHPKSAKKSKAVDPASTLLSPTAR